MTKKPGASGKKKWRIVVDYRKVNKKTIEDWYPLPNIKDVLDILGRCNYFPILDIASVFNVENGHCEYLRMHFGIKNAPATIQRVMDNILRGLQNELCIVFLDDIIIYSMSLQEHILHSNKVSQPLREITFKIQLDKSEFLKKEVAYLGHNVIPQGVKRNPDKIYVRTKEIKELLALLGYCRKSINDFEKITKPLTFCLKKNKN